MAAAAAGAGEPPPPAKRPRVEKRKAKDGEWYTEQDFISHYGGTAEWEAAAPRGARVAGDADMDIDLESAVAAIAQKTNENLVKINTYNSWATETQIRRDLTKKRPSVPSDKEPGEKSRLDAVLPGLVRIGKNPSKAIAYFSFATPEAKEAAIPILTTLKGKKSMFWEVMPVTELDLSHFERKNRDQVRRAHAQSDAKPRTIRDQCEPLHAVPYDEQLRQKEGNLRNTLRDIARNTAREYRGGWKEPSQIPPKWLAALPANAEVCELRCAPSQEKDWPRGIAGSPVTEGYRNKCEFTIGRGKDGDADQVGMLMGSFVEAKAHVATVEDLAIVPDAAKRIAKRLAGYVQTKPDGLRSYDKEVHAGFWRLLLVRLGRRADDGAPGAMAVVQANPTGVPEEALDRIRNGLKDLFQPWHDAREPGNGDPHIASLQLLWYAGKSNSCPEDAPREVLLGLPDIEATLSGMHFKVSPFSFFQINTGGMELVLRMISEFLQLDGMDGEKVLLDLCCGTGAIGICLAKHVRQVVGIDMVEAAIVDAKGNAERNSITNASFHCGRVENLIDSVLWEYKARSDFVAVVDPARGGLHQRVLRFLRECPGLKRFVYVSCEQSSLVRDCGLLLKPQSNSVKGLPFRMAQAAGVDLFPHTNRQEMVALFERIEEDDFVTAEEAKEWSGRGEAPAAAAPAAAAAPDAAAAAAAPASAAAPAAAAAAAATAAAATPAATVGEAPVE
eukprot:TRINITY_DN1979_c3_g1_i1.p1 TRINITY_DN1979_c3_g1~~TRINITY_DN1979_c3_g1_i1.p1  ORF type:complete len:748 (+),score=249.54 TRINITY_DN1979_c3_g1_i1:59-2245(+)